MKDLNELSKLVADMVCKSLLQIIGENINPEAIVENCKTDGEFEVNLFNALRKGLPLQFTSSDINHESVISYLKGLDTQSLMEIINEPDIRNPITVELYEDIVNDYFEDSDGSDIWERCSYRQQDDIREEISDDIYNDAIDDAISALEDKRR